MGRAATRAAPKSGAALRFERQRREATEALRAQAAQVREIRAAQAAMTPPPSAGEGMAKPETGIPVTEQNQQVEATTEVRAEPRKVARNMHAGMHAAPFAEPTIVAAKINTPLRQPGTWPIADLREGQCRFACTSHTARAAEHRFCGEPVVWKGTKPTSWCREHLPVVSGAPGRHAGGASVADVEAQQAAKGA